MLHKNYIFLYLTTLCLICISGNVVKSELRSVFAIGTRILDDQLLVKDHLESRALSSSDTQEIVFNYAVPQPITYVEIVSTENVYAEVNLSYQSTLISGNIKAVTPNVLEDDVIIVGPFSVDISIFGFNDTKLNVSPAYIINRNKEINAIMKPEYDRNEQDYNIGEQQYKTKFDDISYNNSESTINEQHEETQEDDSDFDEDEILERDNGDKIIKLGLRQRGDSLLYESFQTSEATVEPTEHSVVFYYIDSNFITNVVFLLYGHFNGKDIASPEYKPPVAEYTHFSPTSLKAVITDYNSTSLFVQILIYGFGPADVSSHYVPFLSSSQLNPDGITGRTNTENTMSALQRLKILMKQTDKNNAATDLDVMEQNESYPDHNTQCMPQSVNSNAFIIQNNVLLQFLLWFAILYTQL